MPGAEDRRIVLPDPLEPAGADEDEPVARMPGPVPLERLQDRRQVPPPRRLADEQEERRRAQPDPPPGLGHFLRGRPLRAERGVGGGIDHPEPAGGHAVELRDVPPGRLRERQDPVGPSSPTADSAGRTASGRARGTTRASLPGACRASPGRSCPPSPGDQVGRGEQDIPRAEPTTQPEPLPEQPRPPLADDLGAHPRPQRHPREPAPIRGARPGFPATAAPRSPSPGAEAPGNDPPPSARGRQTAAIDDQTHRRSSGRSNRTGVASGQGKTVC